MRKLDKIEIKEDVKIGDMILEAGDKIQVLESADYEDKTFSSLDGQYKIWFDSYSDSVELIKNERVIATFNMSNPDDEEDDDY